MNFFSEDRVNELKNLFFESAQELLQTLNEDGLSLEEDPSNPELVRSIRRTMHTLKGDSAACGYRELSELSHALEDVLTPEIAARSGSQLAELVLSAADVFDGMLSAYKGDLQPPSSESLLAMIKAVVNPDSNANAEFAPTFQWTEYERLVVQQNAVAGQNLVNFALRIDPQCPMRAAALQLIRNVLQEVGTILLMHPDENAVEVPDVVEGVLATYHQQDWIEKKAKVPAVVAEVRVAAYESAKSEPVSEVIPPSPLNLEIEPAPSPGAAPAADHDVLGILAPSSPDAGTSSEPAKKSAKPAAPAPQSDNVLRVDAERIDTVMDLVGELIIGKSMLADAIASFGRRFPKDPLRNQLVDAMSFQSQVLGKLQRSVMKIRMVPVEQLFRRFPRVVRDVSKFEKKQVDLILQGENTDLDKSILDALSEPLTHLVRNAVAHGIETPEERLAAGKPEKGSIKLNAYHQGNQVVIEISDDGRGIDRTKVARKAVEKGVISAEELARLSDGDTLNLIFQCGFSTAERVTEVSGRGVGMDVVKSVMDRLKGQIAIHTELGRGTTFQLKLPLTLAIIKALLFRVSERLYAVPLGSVLEITRAYESDIHVVDNHEVMRLREELLTLVRLRDMVEGDARVESDKVFVVVVALGHRKFGLVVDRMAGEQELVIKALDDDVLSSELVTGASVLGDGRVVLILNISEVVERVGHLTLAHKVGVSV